MTIYQYKSSLVTIPDGFEVCTIEEWIVALGAKFFWDGQLHTITGINDTTFSTDKEDECWAGPNKQSVLWNSHALALRRSRITTILIDEEFDRFKTLLL